MAGLRHRLYMTFEDTQGPNMGAKVITSVMIWGQPPSGQFEFSKPRSIADAAKAVKEELRPDLLKRAQKKRGVSKRARMERSNEGVRFFFINKDPCLYYSYDVVKTDFTLRKAATNTADISACVTLRVDPTISDDFGSNLYSMMKAVADRINLANKPESFDLGRLLCYGIGHEGAFMIAKMSCCETKTVRDYLCLSEAEAASLSREIDEHILQVAGEWYGEECIRVKALDLVGNQTTLKDATINEAIAFATKAMASYYPSPDKSATGA